MLNQLRLVTDDDLTEFFIDIQLGELMQKQQELQRTIKATQKAIEQLQRKFNRVKRPEKKHEHGVALAKLKAKLVVDQAMLQGMVTAQESLDDFRNIPF